MKFEYFWGLKTYVRTWMAFQKNAHLWPFFVLQVQVLFATPASGATGEELAIQAAFHGGRSYILSSLHELFTAPWRSHKSRRGLSPQVFKMESHHHEYHIMCLYIHICTQIHSAFCRYHDVNDVVLFLSPWNHVVLGGRLCRRLVFYHGFAFWRFLAVWGLGWGGDVTVPWTCTHGRCYAMFGVWGGVGWKNGVQTHCA